MAEDGLRLSPGRSWILWYSPCSPPGGCLSCPIVPIPHHPEPIRGARGPERGGPTRSHPEPGRDPPQRRRVLWGCPTGGEAAASPPDALSVDAGEIKYNCICVTRGGAAVARWAHNPKVGGSNPPPATKGKQPVHLRRLFLFVWKHGDQPQNGTEGSANLSFRTTARSIR